VSTDGNLILTKSVKYSLCIYAIITFLVKIITETFSEEGKHLIQFYRKTRHLVRSTSYNQTISRKEMDIKLNAVDYKVWGSCRTGFMLARLPVLTELKQRISDE